MKRIKKGLISCLLTCPLMLTACQLGSGTGDGGDSVNGEIEVWSTYATEKILQDRTDLYEDIRLPARVGVEACKGEYEGAQVIMTATKDVSWYKAEIVSDLVGADGETFSKENIQLYHQKYIELSTIYTDYNHSITGWYPDALLPLDVAVEYKENKIVAGQNQGIYVTFNVPVDQAAGNYTGNMKITYDGQETVVPVTLTVYDLTVSQKTRSLSCFNLGFSGYLGELDSTQNSWRNYTEALLDYRIAPSQVMAVTQSTEESMDAYIEEVVDLVFNHDLSTITVRWPWDTGELFPKFLFKLAQKSIDIDYNLLDYTISLTSDEPKISDMATKIPAEVQDFNTGIQKALKQFDSLQNATSQQIAELKESAKAIPLITTMMYPRCEETNEAGVDTYCPKFQFWHSESDRALYDDQWKGRWWYGCTDPANPYPTYHTHDNMVSPRSVGWMMSEYDIAGNLYWSATVYAKYSYSTGYSPIEDVYSTPDRYPKSYGDGYLFYPGAPYGIDGPVATMRLEAIRDGNEEYEIWYDLKEAYLQAGYSISDIQRAISQLVYSGTIVKYENSATQFIAARKAMIQLALLAKEGVFITALNNNQKGTITCEIVAQEGYTLKAGDQALTGILVGEKVKYSLDVQLDNAINLFAFTVDNGVEEYSFELNLGGKVSYYDAATLYAKGTFSNANATVASKLEAGKLQVDVGAVEGKHQSVRYKADFLGDINKNTQRILLILENPSENPIDIRLLARFEGAALNTELYSGTLQPGENIVEIDLSSIQMKKVSYMDFYFSHLPGTYDAKTIYLNSWTIYDK